MELKKYSLVILSIILILLVFASSASAADTIGTDTLSIDESTNNEKLTLDYSPDTSGESNDTNVVENDGNNLLSEDNDESGNVLKEGTGTYADLETEINDALSSGDYVTLTKDTYTYTGSGSQIEIGKSCTIDGNGAVIDMAGSNIRVFYITASDVTIKNLTIKNANIWGDGGAIYFKTSGTVENCNFTNNTASGEGGAILFYVDTRGTVTNCNFTNNSASDGGAIRAITQCTVTNCNFTNNSASDGGAFMINGGYATNCNFTNNSASDGGGAIDFVGEGTVTNCNFINNKVEGYRFGYGGAIYISRGSVENCNFTNNTVTNGGGGAVFFWNNCNVKNCNFTNNTANKAGAVYIYRMGNLTNCNFTANQATGEGGAIIMGYGNVTNCNFTNNSASFDGGAIDFVGEGTVTNCNFINNKVEGYGNVHGGAIYFGNDISNSNINANFINNTAEYGVGGAIYVNGNVSDSTINGTYTNNQATKGGAIYFNSSVSGSNITGTYTNNTATNDGGANYFNGNVSDSNITGTYTNNKVIACGGANHFHGSVSNSTVTGIYINNTVEQWGGANYFNEYVSGSTITGTYTNNTSVSAVGGANHFQGTVSGSTINGTYTNNSAIQGGANFFRDVLGSTVTGTYTNNNATDFGGANYFLTSVSNSTVTGIYINNTAEHGDGGANYFLDMVSGSNIGGIYTNNKATWNGGAIYFWVASDSNITGTYINNTASNAIICFNEFFGQVLDMQVNNAIFLNNNCTYEISVPNPGIVVKDSWFGNNASNFMNKPNVNKNVTIDNWLFLNATADYSSLLIMDSTNVTFKLYSTDGTDVSDFDNSKLPVVNLTLTATKGDVENTTTLDNNVRYTATEKGEGSVTAKIENASYTIYFDIIGLIVSAPDVTKYYKGPERFIVTVTEGDKGLFNKSVNITINGVTYSRTTDEDGTASLNINLNSGEYQVNVAVDGEEVNSTVTVKATIDASDVVKMFRNDTQYSATFTDVNGTPLANTKVSFNINGMIYNRTTDENGTAVMNINLGEGNYIITAANPVTGEMKSNSIEVISLIESSDLTKYYRNDSQFTVRIHSDNGSYVGAGEEVKFNINGVFYTKKTNATGHATLNINLPQGNYTITTYYKECSQGNSIEVLPILNASDLEMKYRDGSQFKAALVDGQGKAYAGQIVQFNINGMFYNKETDSDGIAKLNINLMPGEYIVTSSYNGFNIANTITISS